MAKLTDVEAKRLKELVGLKKAGKLTDSDESELAALNSKCGFRGGKRGGKPAREKKGKVPYGNDLSWWSKYPELLDNASKIPFNWRPGTGLPTGGTRVESGTLRSVPGVLAIGYMPTCGVLSGDNTDPFNTSMRALWLDMHRKYRGIGSYQQADLGMAIFAIMNAFSLVLNAERIIGYLLWYDTLNLNLPTNLAAAMGVNSTLLNDIHAHARDYVGYLNYLITKIKPLCLPKGLSFIQNLASCLSYVYLDSKDHRSQMILFKQVGYWEFSGSQFNTGSALILHQDARANIPALPQGGATDYVTYLQSIEAVLDRLLGDDDITRMCSDVLAAYGESGIEFMQLIPDGFMLSPVYSEEMLHKIHNSNIVGKTTSTQITGLGNTKVAAVIAADANYSPDDTYIYQENNTVIGRFCPRTYAIATHTSLATQITDSDGNKRDSYPNAAAITSIMAYGSTLLDTWSESPDAKIVVEGCMFKHSGLITEIPQGGNTYYCPEFVTMGVELLFRAEIFSVQSGVVTVNTVAQFGDFSGPANRNYTWGLAVFDWAPYTYTLDGSYTNPSDMGYLLPVGDINNAIPVRVSDLFRIHQIALLSAFKFDPVTYIN